MTHAPTRVTTFLRARQRAKGLVTIQECAQALGLVHSTLYRRLRGSAFTKRDQSGTHWVDVKALAADHIARGDDQGAVALMALLAPPQAPAAGAGETAA